MTDSGGMATTIGDFFSSPITLWGDPVSAIYKALTIRHNFDPVGETVMPQVNEPLKRK
jgi:hypothetical protein